MASNIPVIVQGNSFSLAIPLQIYYINGDQMDLQDYYPDPTDQVSIQLKGCRRQYTYTPSIADNVANIDLSGNELADNYSVVVAIVKQDGTRLRSFRTDQFFIVESSDDLTPADIIEGLEENVIYLNSSIFVAGADGRGIESIVKTATAGLVDTYTITYTDDTTSTFNVTNGAAGATIASIEKTATVGKVDTYTITMTDGNTFDFEVTNGMDGVDLGLANIVNDLTTGGSTNVLSAEMGKVLNEKIFTLSPNLFDKTRGYNGYYVKPTDGGRYVNSAWKTTDFIDISAFPVGTLVSVSPQPTYPSGIGVAFYDASQNYRHGGQSALAIQSGDKYFRASIPITAVDTTMVVAGDVPSDYMPFGAEFLKDDIVGASSVVDGAITTNKIANGAVTTQKLGEDLMGNSNVGGYLDQSGNVVNDNTWGYSDYIPYNRSANITWRWNDSFANASAYLIVYNSAKAVIDYFSATLADAQSGGRVINKNNVASGAAYIRASFVVGSQASIKIGDTEVWSPVIGLLQELEIGGAKGGTQKIVPITLSAGYVDTSDGKMLYGTTGSELFQSLTHRKLLRFDATADTIVSVDYDTTLNDLTIFAYGSDGSCVGIHSSINEIGAATKYLRFQLTNKNFNLTTHAGVYTKAQNSQIITVTMVTTNEQFFIPDSQVVPLYNVHGYDYYGFQYELNQVPLDIINQEPTTDYVGNGTTRAINSGCIVLPPNYRESKEPVPLIIYCASTNGFYYKQTPTNAFSTQKRINIKYITDMGYAVATCSTFTNRYTPNVYGSLVNEELNELDPSCNLGYQCYVDLYKYVVDNFNVRKDGAYLISKSAGGLNSALFSNIQPFPVKACAALAPSLDIYANFKILAFAKDVNWWASRLGMPNPAIEGSRQWSDATKQYLLDNYQKLIGFEPLWQNISNADLELFAQRLINVGFSTAAMEADTQLVNIVNNAAKTQIAPIKIWHAVDDANVPIATSRFYKKMVDNGGGVCVLREFPSGCGQHSAPDEDGCPTMSATPLYGSTMTVPVGIVEAVEWFMEWS